MNTLESTLACMAGLGSLFLSSSILLGALPAPSSSTKSKVEAVRLAASLQRDGNSAAAVDVLDAYLNDHPDDLEVHVEKARYLAFGRHFAEAAKEFETVLDRDGNMLAATLGMAKVRSWEGDFVTALGLYDQILERSPNLYDARVGKAFTLLWMGQKQQAVALFRWAARSHPDDREVKQALAELGYVNEIENLPDTAERRVGSGRSSSRTSTMSIKVSSFPEPISTAAVIAPTGRFPVMATVAVSSVGIMLCGTLMFLWKTQQPYALPMQSITQEVHLTVIPLPDPARRTTPESNHPATEKPRILIVEGNANVLEFERAVFSGAGFEVAAVTNGVEALRLLREGPYALAVLDAHVSGEISCVDLLNAIRKHIPELHSRLVLTTSCTADAVRLRNATAHRVLSKPLKMSDLLSVLPTAEVRTMAAAAHSQAT